MEHIFTFAAKEVSWAACESNRKCSILVPIALFASLNQRRLGTRNENFLVPRLRRLRQAERAMGTRMKMFFFLSLMIMIIAIIISITIIEQLR